MRWLIVLALCAAPVHARSVAVVPFGEAAQEVEPSVRGALAKVVGVRLSAAAPTMTDVEAARQIGLACGPQSDECLVKLALFLRVDQLVALAATRTAEGMAVELTLVDAALGKRAGTVAFTLGADGPAAQLDDAALLLLVPDQSFGAVILDLVPAGARVSVDNETPVSAAQLRLRAGEHSIEVSQDGYQSERRTVTVRPASTTTLSVSLAPTPAVEIEPPQPQPQAGPSPTFITGAAVAGAGAIAMLGGGVAALILDGALGTPQGSAEERDQMQWWGRAAAALGVVGAVALVAGGVVLVGAE